MPKDVNVKELQDIRHARKAKMRRYPLSHVHLQVLGSGAPGAPKSLYVFTGQTSYLFNCGEGSQRLASEHKIKLAMLENVLITHKSWGNVGGLPGILLSLQDNGVPEVNLHGPPGFALLHKDARHFLFLRDLHVNHNHYTANEGTFGDDDSLRIQAIPLWAKECVGEKDNEISAETMEVEDVFGGYKRPIHRNDKLSPEVRQQMLKESQKCKNLAVAYVCRPPPKAGALLLDKVVKAGVPPGPLFGSLKRGEDVTLPDGRVVLSSDVTLPDDPGPVFIVIEVPTEAYLDSLLESPAFGTYQASATNEENIAELVVHFTPSRIMQDPRYKEWISRFSTSTNHMCLNDSNTCLGSEAVHRMQYKLNLLSKNLFPLLNDQSIPLKENNESEGEESESKNICDKEEKGNDDVLLGNSSKNETFAEDSSKNVADSSHNCGPMYQANTLTTYHIRPKNRLDRSNNITLTPETYIEECYKNEGFESALAHAKSKMMSLEQDLEKMEQSDSYPNVMFLGTGCSVPSKDRNSSSILVNLKDDKNFIMDCGEGTYTQMVRLLGVAASNEVLRCMRAVYISHLHVDHHIGLITLLLARRQAFKLAGIEQAPKLLLLAPQHIMAYLSSFHENFERICQDFTLIENHRFLRSEFRSLVGAEYLKVCEVLDMKSIDMTYVLHCPSAFGVAWTHKDGWKLVYSGDTMPCEDLVRIGQNCDLLIHEATMEDGLEDDAKIKTHSTISQAIKVGKDMKAKHTMLTHFSQRYSKVPLLEGDVPENVGIAFDNMKVHLRKYPPLNHMYKALVAMFAEHYDEMLEKKAKKLFKKEQMKELMEKKEEKRLANKTEQFELQGEKLAKKKEQFELQVKELVEKREEERLAKKQKTFTAS